MAKLTLAQLERHLYAAADILRGEVPFTVIQASMFFTGPGSGSPGGVASVPVGQRGHDMLPSGRGELDR